MCDYDFANSQPKEMAWLSFKPHRQQHHPHDLVRERTKHLCEILVSGVDNLVILNFINDAIITVYGGPWSKKASLERLGLPGVFDWNIRDWGCNLFEALVQTWPRMTRGVSAYMRPIEQSDCIGINERPEQKIVGNGKDKIYWKNDILVVLNPNESNLIFLEETKKLADVDVSIARLAEVFIATMVLMGTTSVQFRALVASLGRMVSAGQSHAAYALWIHLPEHIIVASAAVIPPPCFPSTLPLCPHANDNLSGFFSSIAVQDATQAIMQCHPDQINGYYGRGLTPFQYRVLRGHPSSAMRFARLMELHHVDDWDYNKCTGDHSKVQDCRYQFDLPPNKPISTLELVHQHGNEQLIEQFGHPLTCPYRRAIEIVFARLNTRRATIRESLKTLLTDISDIADIVCVYTFWGYKTNTDDGEQGNKVLMIN